MNKKLLSLLILITVSVTARAQWISDVTFSQEGEKAIISYTLDLGSSSKLYNVWAYITIDGKQSFIYMQEGDVGTIESSGLKHIEADIFWQFKVEELEGDISFQVVGDKKQQLKPTITFEYIYSPTAPYGATFAYCSNRWGGYLNFKIGKIRQKELIHTYLLDDYNMGGRAGFARTDVIAGVVVRLHRLVYLYGGLGYGNYEVAHKYNTKSTASTSSGYISTDKREGMAYEVGARVVLGKVVSVSVGFNSILSGEIPLFADFHVGVGFTF